MRPNNGEQNTHRREEHRCRDAADSFARLRHNYLVISSNVVAMAPINNAKAGR